MDWLPAKTESKIIQGSQEWHEYRSRHIGASEIPIVLGVSPYKTARRLWLEKTNQVDKFAGNWATKRGQDLEPLARDIYNEKHGTKMHTDVEEHREHKFLSASYDGIDREIKRVIEIKCPGAVDHQLALSGEVPKKYIPQVQAQLMISGYQELDYVSFDGTEIAVVRVAPDIEMHKLILIEASRFWDYVQNRFFPEEEENKIVNDENLLNLLDQREEIKSEIDALSIAFEAVTLEIKKIAINDCICGDFEIKWIEKKGSIDYSKVPQLQGADLEQFRKQSIRYQTIKTRQTR